LTSLPTPLNGDWLWIDTSVDADDESLTRKRFPASQMPSTPGSQPAFIPAITEASWSIFSVVPMIKII
jgi:hypothetical protein